MKLKYNDVLSYLLENFPELWKLQLLIDHSIYFWKRLFLYLNKMYMISFSPISLFVHVLVCVSGQNVV